MKDNIFALRQNRYQRMRHFEDLRSAKSGAWVPMKTTRAFKGDGRAAIGQRTRNEPLVMVSSAREGEGRLSLKPLRKSPGNRVAVGSRCMNLPARNGGGDRTERPEAIPRLPKESSSTWPGVSRRRTLVNWPKEKSLVSEFKVEVSIAPVEPQTYHGSRPARGGMGTRIVHANGSSRDYSAPVWGRAGKVQKDGARVEYPVVGPFELFEFSMRRRPALKLAKQLRSGGKRFWTFPSQWCFPKHLAPLWKGRLWIRRHAAKVRILPKLKPLETLVYQVCNGCRRAFPPESFIPCKGGAGTNAQVYRFS
jgi:hypothetical protein